MELPSYLADIKMGWVNMTPSDKKELDELTGNKDVKDLLGYSGPPPEFQIVSLVLGHVMQSLLTEGESYGVTVIDPKNPNKKLWTLPVNFMELPAHRILIDANFETGFIFHKPCRSQVTDEGYSRTRDRVLSMASMTLARIQRPEIPSLEDYETDKIFRALLSGVNLNI